MDNACIKDVKRQWDVHTRATDPPDRYNIVI